MNPKKELTISFLVETFTLVLGTIAFVGANESSKDGSWGIVEKFLAIIVSVATLQGTYFFFKHYKEKYIMVRNIALWYNLMKICVVIVWGLLLITS